MAQVNGSQSNGHNANKSKYDPNFTQNVINATGPKALPRMRTVMGSLIRHLHDFCRENEITIEEWTQAVDLVCGRLALQLTFANEVIARLIKLAECPTTDATKVN